MKRSKFREDYYRLRGGKNSPLLLDILFRHNIRFLLWFRKYTEARTPFGRLLFRFALFGPGGDSHCGPGKISQM